MWLLVYEMHNLSSIENRSIVSEMASEMEIWMIKSQTMHFNIKYISKSSHTH